MASEVLKLIFRGQDDTTKAVRSLRGNLAKAEKGIDQVRRSLGGVKTAIGLTAGAAGFGALAKNALESADRLGKVSQALGTTASDLASLQLAANYAGVETDSFNRLMQVFQKRVGEAAQGTGQAKDQLEAFGIDAERLAQLPLPQQLAIIADEFAGLKTPAEQAAAASALGSNRFIELIPLLQGGSEGLREVREEFRRTGQEISDNQVDAIEDFNDSMTKLGGIINTAMIAGLSGAAPVMEDFAEKAAEMAVPLVGDLFDGLNFILDNIDAISTGVQVLVGAMVTAKVVAFANGVALMVTNFRALSLALTANPIGLIATAIGAAVTAVVLFKDEIAAMITKVTDFLGITEPLSNALSYVSGLFGDNEKAVKDNTDATEDATKETDHFEKAVDDLQKTVKKTEPPIQDFAESVDDTAAEEKKAAVETDEFREALEKLRKASRTSTDEFEDAEEQLKEMKRAVDAGRASMEDYEQALRNTIGEVTGVDDELGDLRREIDDTKRAIDLLSGQFGENDAQVVALKKRLEELGGELVDLTRETGGFTDEQRELLEEVTKSEREVEALAGRIADLTVLYESGAIDVNTYKKETAAARGEIESLRTEMEGLPAATEGAFDTKPVTDFFEAIAGGASPSGALGDLAGALVGSGGVQEAIAGCFGTKPVTDFDQAVRDLFTGNGSALGAFQGALGSLTTALGDFFRDGEFSFSAFKDAILRTLSEIAAGAIASVGINFLKNLIPGLNTGGEVQGYATGGRVTGMGGPKEDKVLARLSPGEYVINAASVSKFGTSFFEQLNSGKMPGFATGGSVPMPTLPSFPSFTSSDDDFFQRLVEWLLTDSRDTALQDLFRDRQDRLENDIGQLISNVTSAVTGSTDFTEQELGVSGLFGSNYKTPIIDAILATILSDSSPFAVERALDGFPRRGLFEALRDALFPPTRDIQAAPIEFNMDDVVARLFNSAQGVAGGALTLAAREQGGPLERGQPSLVGEGGPELFIPGRGGTVSPITRDGANQLVEAVHEVRDEISDLRRQFSRALSGGQLAGGRSQ